MGRQIGVGTFTVNDRMRELVTQVLDSGRISYGPLSREFEQRFSQIHECKFGVLSNSGTSSLHVALQAMKELYDWRDGDEVITQSVTFVATVNTILHNRLKPVLVDVDEYYGLDVEQLEAAITPRTRCIVPVHLFGQPCDMTSIVDIAQVRHLKVLEDSCECMFVKHNGRMTGSWGDAACFSLYVAHLLTAGVGGISTTNDPDLACKMRSLVNHGRDGIYISIDDDKGLTEKQLQEVVERRFNFQSIGHSFRVTELEAALALGQLDGWDQMIAKRRANAEFLHRELLDLPVWPPEARPHTESANMMFPIVVRGSKWPVCNHLEKRGIETREMLRLTDQPVYKGLWNPKDYPMAEWLNKSGFYVGCSQNLDLEDMAYIADVLREYYRIEERDGSYYLHC